MGRWLESVGLASERPGFDSFPGHVTLTSSCPLPDLSLQICKMSLPRLRLLLGTQRRVKTGWQEGGCGYFVMDSGPLSQPTRREDFSALQERAASPFERSLISVFTLVLILTSSS